MPPKKCYVHGCTSCTTTGEQLFRFPDALRDEKRFLTWFTACSNASLSNIPPQNMLFRYVCKNHFEKKYILNKRLCRTAVPTLNLPEGIVVEYNGLEGISNALPVTGEESNVVNVSMITSENLDGSQESVLGMDQKRSQETESEEEEHHENRTESEEMNLGYPLRVVFVARTGRYESIEDKRIYDNVTMMLKCFRQCRARREPPRKRLQIAEKLIKKGKLRFIAEFSESYRNLLASHFKTMARRKLRRSYSKLHKIYALVLLRRNPLLYKFLSAALCLPSAKTIYKFCTNIDIRPGISKSIFKALHAKICLIRTRESRYCVLSFDEVSLAPSFIHDTKPNTVGGFGDKGYEHDTVVDHAGVWMLKGIEPKPWKQLIGFTFSQGSCKPEEIARMFRSIVSEAINSGLEIVAFVCDHAAVNVEAVNILISNTKPDASDDMEINYNIIVADGQEVIHLYDPPKLFQSFRNNFLTHNVQFMDDDRKVVTANWSHIEASYNFDKTRGKFCLMRLSDKHVIPSQIKKRNIYCAKIFNYRVASAVSFFSEHKFKFHDNLIVGPEGHNTATLMVLLSNLFDSLNGSFKSTTSSNVPNLRRVIRTADPNCKKELVWKEAISKFEDMKLVRRKSSDKTYPNFFRYWIHTLHGFLSVKKSFKDLDIPKFSTGIFNLNALRIVFQKIRRGERRNVKPTCSEYVAFLRTIIIKHFVQSHRHANCDLSDCPELLDDLLILFDNKLNKPCTSGI